MPDSSSRETSPPVNVATTRVSATNRPTTRNTTKKTGSAPKTILTKDDVQNAIDGRRFLEKKLLLCAAGEPPTITSLSYCLHQVSEMNGILNPIANGKGGSVPH
jgi:hypothetical protein